MGYEYLPEAVPALERFADELCLRCREDPWCRECSRVISDRTPAYENAVQHLTPEQRKAVEDYIAACEEMEYSRVYVAYALGREDQQQGIPPFPLP